MTNYLNQIESDLYKLNSITNGSGEVVEMVAELKEKYDKAKAYDAIAINIKALRKHMLDSGRSVNNKSIETETTLKHIEKIIEGVSYYHD